MGDDKHTQQQAAAGNSARGHSLHVQFPPPPPLKTRDGAGLGKGSEAYPYQATQVGAGGNAGHVAAWILLLVLGVGLVLGAAWAAGKLIAAVTALGILATCGGLGGLIASWVEREEPTP